MLNNTGDKIPPWRMPLLTGTLLENNYSI